MTRKPIVRLTIDEEGVAIAQILSENEAQATIGKNFYILIRKEIEDFNEAIKEKMSRLETIQEIQNK